MSREVLDYLDDILENALAACEFTNGLTADAFAADRKTLYAVMRALEIIREAANRIPDDMRARHPDIDWRGMAGLRDVIAQLPNIIDRLRKLIVQERRLAGETDG